MGGGGPSRCLLLNNNPPQTCMRLLIVLQLGQGSRGQPLLFHVQPVVATQLELETLLAWLTCAAGKSVLATRWELGWGCQPGPRFSFTRGCLDFLPHGGEVPKETGASPFKAQAKEVNNTGKNRFCKKFGCGGRGKHCTVREREESMNFFFVVVFFRVGETCPTDVAQWTMHRPKD